MLSKLGILNDPLTLGPFFEAPGYIFNAEIGRSKQLREFGLREDFSEQSFGSLETVLYFCQVPRYGQISQSREIFWEGESACYFRVKDDLLCLS